MSVDPGEVPASPQAIIGQTARIVDSIRAALEKSLLCTGQELRSLARFEKRKPRG